jgi:predicted NBD/HSP70 family sugar kinase
MLKNNFLRETETLTEKQRRSLLIMDAIRRYGPISRPQISDKVGLNVVTISHYIDDFLRKNLIIEKEFDVSEGGRRPLLLDLNPEAGYTIGVGINLTHIVGLLMDIKGNIIYKIASDITGVVSTDIVSKILEVIRKILQRYKNYSHKIKGVGVGIAGLINKRTGSIHWPQRIKEGYDYISVDIPLREMIEKEFDLPALIDNDATCACFGETWSEKELEWSNILYMFSGVGCGIMFEGRIYRGTSGYAGEVSIHNYKEKDLFKCEMGSPCFLKRWEKDLGVVEDLKKRLNLNNNYTKQILELIDNRIENITLKTIFTAQRLNNPLALEVLKLAAKRLGIKVAFLVNLLNPEAVIVGGGWEEAGDEFLKEVTQTVKDWAFREVVENLRIVYSKLRENASAYGAAALTMEKFFAYV